jgi:hypothetical protein
VGRIWEDAASILETASAAGQDESSDIAILIDSQNALRIVDAGGWQLDALRREYQAAAAYSVKRTAQSVVVEAQDGQSQCTLKKALGGQLPFSAMSGIPQHLIRPERMLLA